MVETLTGIVTAVASSGAFAGIIAVFLRLGWLKGTVERHGATLEAQDAHMRDLDSRVSHMEGANGVQRQLNGKGAHAA